MDKEETSEVMMDQWQLATKVQKEFDLSIAKHPHVIQKISLKCLDNLYEHLNKFNQETNKLLQ